MHIAEVVTIAKSLPLLRLNTYKSLILSYSADYRRIFWKKLFWFLKAYSSALIKTRMKNIALLTYTWFMAKHFYCFSKFCQYFTKVRIVISDDYSSNIVYSIFIYQNKVHTY